MLKAGGRNAASIACPVSGGAVTDACRHSYFRLALCQVAVSQPQAIPRVAEPQVTTPQTTAAAGTFWCGSSPAFDTSTFAGRILL